MIKVLQAGLCDTVQDCGRVGYASSGLGPSGPLDWFSAALANACLANPPDAAVLEMHYPSPHLFFETDALIALSGASASALVNGRSVSNNRLLTVQRGSELRFTHNNNAVCHYLAVKGGIAVPQVLNSRSAHLRAPLGGLAERRLQQGDSLPVGVHINRSPQASFSINTHQVMQYARVRIGVLEGPDFKRLSSADQGRLMNASFTVTANRDRMGMRLSPSASFSNMPAVMPSAPVEPGTIQLLPSGELALLLADAQTVGGYPRILQVARASLPIVVQKAPGSVIEPERVSLSDALYALALQKDYLSRIRRTSALLFHGS